MTRQGAGPIGFATDVRISILFCTRLPFPYAAPIESHDMARATWAFPVAGALVGGLGAAVYGGATWLWLPAGPAAALALATTLLATGCLHEDGLADTADGFGGGRDRAGKLDIMRDSRLGTYGACALVVSLLMRWSALAAIGHPVAAAAALVAAHAGARAALPGVMHMVAPARRDGLSAGAGQPSPQVAAIAVVLGTAALWLALGATAAIIAVALLGAACVFMAWLSVRQIGGLTGDVLGALEQVGEVAVLLVAAAVARAPA